MQDKYRALLKGSVFVSDFHAATNETIHCIRYDIAMTAENCVIWRIIQNRK
jgi:hypothetical protein